MKKWSTEEINILIENINKTYDELSILINRSKFSVKNKIRMIKNRIDDKIEKEEKYLKYNNIDWDEVQKFYNEDNMWSDVIVKFKVSNTTLNKAVKNNKFKTRPISESLKISKKKYPVKHTDETKKKISEIRIKYLKEHPEKVPYLLNHYSKGESYPERYFDKIFKLYELKYEKLLQISIYQLDFAFIENGINIEIDGEQHYSDKRIVESNERKDEYLKSLGWEIIRIRWSYYISLNKEDRKKYINQLIDYIKNNKLYKPILIKNENKCIDCDKEINKRSIRCRNCDGIKKGLKYRKIKNRPSFEQLNNDVKELGYSGTGRKYGVSDNCIRKWIKNKIT